MTVTPTLPSVITNCFSTEILPSFFPEIINRIVDCYSLRCVFCYSVHSFGYPLFNFSLLSLRNELVSEDIKNLNELVKKNLINKKALELYSQIDKNFIEVSLNGKLYKKEIWTLKALKNDLFWKKQRILAKQFINELLNK